MQFHKFEKTLFRRENSCSKHVFCEILMIQEAFVKGKVTISYFVFFKYLLSLSAKTHKNVCFLSKIVYFLTLCVFLVPEQCFGF